MHYAIVPRPIAHGVAAAIGPICPALSQFPWPAGRRPVILRCLKTRCLLNFLDLVRFPVVKPARYLGAEFFPTGYRPKQSGDLSVCLAYPDAYEVGMSNTGISILYSILRRLPGVYVDAAFCPWPDMEQFLRQTGNPLISRHGALPLKEFDVLGFSLQYELTYTNLLTMLDLAGIPLYAAQRTGSDPLILAGGPCTTHPEPVAPFIDAFLLGDGEEALPLFLETVRAGRAQGLGRQQLLESVANLPGVYVPALVPFVAGQALPAVDRQVILDLDKDAPFLDFPVPALETIFDRLSLELARGCQGGCRFCEAGFTYRPPRERSVPALLQWVEQALNTTGLEEVSLASLSTADYTGLSELVQKVSSVSSSKRTSFTVSSLRAYGLQTEVLDFLAKSRSCSLTLAPEAGSQRLRDVINKNITEMQILEAVHRAGQWGWNRLKLYFMLGLPTETQEDLEAIRKLAFTCMDVMRGRFGKRAELSLAFSLFVPRPHTPFQWERMATLDELRGKVEFIQRSMRRPGVEVKWHSPQMSVVEGILARGDRTLAPAIEAVWRAGARFDSWEEHLRFDLWDKALTETGIDRYKFLGAQPVDSVLPWEHVQVGVTKEYLLRERDQALQAASTAPCTPFAASGRICHACGAKCAPKAAPASAEGNSDVTQGAPAQGDAATTGAHAASAFSRPPIDPGMIRPVPPVGHLMIAWQKLGNVCLLGHLDTQRHMLLTLRRAGLQLAYSHGYHPRPRIVFPPALPLGFLGLDEWLDVALEKLPETEGLLEKLQALCLPGIRFTRVGLIPAGQPMVDLAQPKAVSYVVAFSNPSHLKEVLELFAQKPVGHFRSVEQVEEAAWWPEKTTPHALRIGWAFQNAPRIDRYLKEALPHVDIPWVAREQLVYAQSPI